MLRERNTATIDLLLATSPSVPQLEFVAMPRRLQILIGLVAAVLFTVPIAIEVLHFVDLAVLLLRFPPFSDAQLYLAMGRGWANGLYFYRDLFESKPPGVFLLAAVAIKTGAGYPFYIW